MKRHIIILLILLLVSIFITIKLQAGTVDDLASLRWAVLTRCHISVSGTDQISIAEVDSFINEAQQAVATDFPAYIKIDTIALVYRQLIYSLNTDFVESPNEATIQWCIRKLNRKGKNDTTSAHMQVVPSTQAYENVVPSVDKADPYRVWASAKTLVVHPIPPQPDTLIFGYKAYPPKLLHADSVTYITENYREHLIQWTCWKVLSKVGRDMEAATFVAWYMTAKQKRTARSVTMEEVTE